MLPDLERQLKGETASVSSNSQHSSRSACGHFLRLTASSFSGWQDRFDSSTSPDNLLTQLISFFAPLRPFQMPRMGRRHKHCHHRLCGSSSSVLQRLVELQLLLPAVLVLLLATTLGLACRVSEFSCKGSGNSGTICVPLDKYCDGRSDCADGSDEPKHCSGE